MKPRLGIPWASLAIIGTLSAFLAGCAPQPPEGKIYVLRVLDWQGREHLVECAHPISEPTTTNNCVLEISRAMAPARIIPEMAPLELTRASVVGIGPLELFPPDGVVHVPDVAGETP